MTAKMTPEQRKARRLELAAEKKAAEDRAALIKKHRDVLAEVYHRDTGEHAVDYMLGPPGEDEVPYDSSEFVDWLIMRYVRAAGSSYAMTRADGQRILDIMKKNEQRQASDKERELVERYVGKEGN